jgi:hypothetical protein
MFFAEQTAEELPIQLRSVVWPLLLAEPVNPVLEITGEALLDLGWGVDIKLDVQPLSGEEGEGSRKLPVHLLQRVPQGGDDPRLIVRWFMVQTSVYFVEVPSMQFISMLVC